MFPLASSSALLRGGNTILITNFTDQRSHLYSIKDMDKTRFSQDSDFIIFPCLLFTESGASYHLPRRTPTKDGIKILEKKTRFLLLSQPWLGFLTISSFGPSFERRKRAREKKEKKEKMIWKKAYHPNIGVVTEARFADDWEVGALPSISLRVSQQPMRHSGRRKNRRKRARYAPVALLI